MKKYEKLLQEWLAAGSPMKCIHTLAIEDFAYWLDQRREGKKKWIKNTGVKPDLPNHTKIEVKLRGVPKGKATIGSLERWTLDGDIGDILEYKVVK